MKERSYSQEGKEEEGMKRRKEKKSMMRKNVVKDKGMRIRKEVVNKMAGK